MKKTVVSQPLREPRHWNVVKRAETPFQLFGGEDAFPALGPAPPAQRVEFPEIVGEQKEPSEVKEESTEQEQEPQELGQEESQEQTIVELQESELKEEQTAEAEPPELQASQSSTVTSM